MGRIGFQELLIVFAIILLVFGPSKLPALAKSLGQAIKEFKKGSKEVTDKIEELANEPVEEVKTAVKEAVLDEEEPK